MQQGLLGLLLSTLIASGGTLLASAPGVAQTATCVGDCSGNGKVTVDEILTGVNIALNTVQLNVCSVFDGNHDNKVTVDEILTAVNAALAGCPPTPSVTSTPSPTATASPTPAPPDQGADSVQTASRLAVGAIDNIQILDFGFVGVVGAAASGESLSSPSRRAAAPIAVADTCSAAISNFRCGLGGTLTVECSQSLLVVTYNNCTFTSTSGNETLARTGRFSQQISDGSFCQCMPLDPFNPSAPGDVAVTQTFGGAGASSEFAETASGGGKRLRTRALSITRVAQPQPGGCMGVSRTETLDGSLHSTCDPNVDADCTATTKDVSLRPHSLRLDRQSSGVPCRTTVAVDGSLDVDNAATGEQYQQTFAGFHLTQTPQQDDGSTLLTEVGGQMAVSCFGVVTFQTDSTKLLRFTSGATCPSDGLLTVTSPASVLTTTALRPDTFGTAGVAPAPSNAASVVAVEGYHETKFRAANGPLYQVVQNIDGAPRLGAEDVLVTTVAGSLDSVAGCSDTPQQSTAEAVASAAAGHAVPLAAVFASDLLNDASAPCFNPNAADGAGVVCIGSGCHLPDCICLGANCQTFTRGARSIEQGTNGVRPATLVDRLAGEHNTTCSSAVVGRSAYSFGSVAPTTVTGLCQPAPSDGFTLAPGKTVIFAYDAPLLTSFDAGSAGFFVDHDGRGSNCNGTGTDRVVGTMQVDSNPINPPRVHYTAGRGLEFNLSGVQDPPGVDVIDKAVGSCLNVPLLHCPGGPTPTPTPTLRPVCDVHNLGNRDPIIIPILQNVTTTGLPNTFAGASCGDGGNHAPDVAYKYQAPADGYYTIDTLDNTNFDTVLYVRSFAGDLVPCTNVGEQACNDDANAATTGSQVGLNLRKNDAILIVVDGFGSASGSATLRVQRSASSPTPTPTRTPDLSRNPDLAVVTPLSVPTMGIIGAALDVSATVVNQGASDAGAFRIAIVLAADAELASIIFELLDCDVNTLGTGKSTNCGGRVSLPASLTNGTYYIGAVADSGKVIVERDESNNTRSQSIMLSGGTDEPTATATLSPTFPATPTPTVTPTPSVTATAVPTSTKTALPSPTNTPAVTNGVVGTGTANSCTESALDTALAGGGSVTFNCGPSPVTITVASTKTISTDTTIDGGSLITISGGNSAGVFSVNTGIKVMVQNLTIANGYTQFDGNVLNNHAVGAVHNSGTLSITNSTFSDNKMGGAGCCVLGGGAIFNDGTLTVTGSTFSGNATVSGAASGGAIFNFGGTLTVTNSSFSNNSSIWQGGALSIDSGSAMLTNSTFSGNSAGASTNNTGGGAIRNGGTLTVSNSTFSGNSSRKDGGAIDNGGGMLTVINSTFSGNSGSGGGIANAGTAAILNTIMANNSGGNCTGTITDGGHNLRWPSSDTSCVGDFGDPQLATLADNGGPTQTMALQSGSAAINGGDNTICAAAPVNNLDQRGFARPGSGSANCSIGAYEFNSPSEPTPAATLAATATLTFTPTLGIAPTSTSVPPPTATKTPSSTSTLTPSAAPTGTPASTRTATTTSVATSTSSPTLQSTATLTLGIPSASPTPSSTPTAAPNPAAIVVADFNNDTKLDLATANQGNSSVSILLGTGGGSFGAPVSYGVGQQPVTIVAGDFNQDGAIDLATGSTVGDGVSVLLGTGNGTFSTLVAVPVPLLPFPIISDSVVSLAEADFNLDGKLDLVALSPSFDNVSFLLGTGTGTFSFAQRSSVDLILARALVAGNFTSDPFPDLAVVGDGQGGGLVRVMKGTGTGGFDVGFETSVGQNPVSLAVGDFNKDFVLDLAVTNLDTPNENTVTILLGAGDGTFPQKLNKPVGMGAASVVVGDFDHDGNLDLATANLVDNTVSVLLGLGNGDFKPVMNYQVGVGPTSIATGHFDAGAILDLVTTNAGDNTVSVLLGTLPPGGFGEAAPFPVGATSLVMVPTATPTSVPPTFTSVPSPTATNTPSPPPLSVCPACDANANQSVDQSEVTAANANRTNGCSGLATGVAVGCVGDCDGDGAVSPQEVDLCAAIGGCFPSTYALLQKAIWDNHGCTNSLCHGSTQAGGLDLREGASYFNIRAPSTIAALNRIQPGDEEQSLLWLQLAAATLGRSGVPGSPMPLGLPPISANELEAVRLWIRGSAPPTGVVAGVQELLNGCAFSFQCGNGVTEPGEDCDDGGTCIGGTNAGTHCTSESQCTGNGVCAGGTRLGTACISDADCSGDKCMHCVPQGGDGCAANCTSETSVIFQLKPGVLIDFGARVQQGTSGSTMQGDALVIPLPLSGSQTMVIGKQRDGIIPLVVRAASVKFDKISVNLLACTCVRGVAAKTCGGTVFRTGGVGLATDCTPDFTAGDTLCPVDKPCAFVHGPGNSATGTLGCTGFIDLNSLFTQDDTPAGTSCSSSAECAAFGTPCIDDPNNPGTKFCGPFPPEITFSGTGPAGSSNLLTSTATGQVLGACPANFCTDADPQS